MVDTRCNLTFFRLQHHSLWLVWLVWKAAFRDRKAALISIWVPDELRSASRDLGGFQGNSSGSQGQFRGVQRYFRECHEVSEAFNVGGILITSQLVSRGSRELQGSFRRVSEAFPKILARISEDPWCVALCPKGAGWCAVFWRYFRKLWNVFDVLQKACFGVSEDLRHVTWDLWRFSGISEEF